MSEEEKKAVEILNTFELRRKTKNYKEISLEDSQSVEIVLNLIEKQQKKIDELKKYEKYYEEMEEVNKKFISVDKIKNKIEEVKSSKENYTFTLTSEDIRRTIITNLQELLEEE